MGNYTDTSTIRSSLSLSPRLSVSVYVFLSLSHSHIGNAIDLVYHSLLYRANSNGHQPMGSEYCRISLKRLASQAVPSCHTMSIVPSIPSTLKPALQ
jgi:hypothetical protein